MSSGFTALLKHLFCLTNRNLRDVDSDSYSDPFCVVSVTETGSDRQRQFRETGRTEVVKNCLSPQWSTKIPIRYYFAERQRLKVDVFDDSGHGEKSNGQLLGHTSITLAEIVGSKFNRITKKLAGFKGDCGDITVSAEELSDGRQPTVYFSCSASNLDKKDFLGLCDPFLQIFRINKDGSRQLAHRTKYVDKNLNPKWRPFEIHLSQLCYGDGRRPFMVECYDYDEDGSHDLVGRCQTTIDRLMHKVDRDLPLINEKKAAKKGKKYVDSGILHFDSVVLWMDYTFLDFISGGTELDFTVAVDFSRSGNALSSNDAESTHNMKDPTRPNQYEIAIRSIAEICQYYNRSQRFEAYGFGARLAYANQPNTMFPLNVDTDDPICVGISGLLEAYCKAVAAGPVGGPTNFAPIIRLAAQKAANLPVDGRRYCVLLLITGGVITDMHKTKTEIVKASSLPLSIIVIGVGYDSFGEMQELDSDNKLLSVDGKYARRDIVQFVQLRRFLPPHRVLSPDETLTAMDNLAKEVLAEIPAQLTGYMKSKGIYPNNPNLDQNASIRDERSRHLNRTQTDIQLLSRNKSPIPPPDLRRHSTKRTPRLLPATPVEQFRELEV